MPPVVYRPYNNNDLKRSTTICWGPPSHKKSQPADGIGFYNSSNYLKEWILIFKNNLDPSVIRAKKDFTGQVGSTGSLGYSGLRPRGSPPKLKKIFTPLTRCSVKCLQRLTKAS